VVKKLFAAYDASVDWLGRGFHTVIPEMFIVATVVVVLVGWWVLARWLQRCPHCHRFVRRAYSGALRCRRCGRQYYYGVRAMR
jgi:hypothetical protein